MGHQLHKITEEHEFLESIIHNEQFLDENSNMLNRPRTSNVVKAKATENQEKMISMLRNELKKKNQVIKEAQKKMKEKILDLEKENNKLKKVKYQ